MTIIGNDLGTAKTALMIIKEELNFSTQGIFLKKPASYTQSESNLGVVIAREPAACDRSNPEN